MLRTVSRSSVVLVALACCQGSAPAGKQAGSGSPSTLAVGSGSAAGCCGGSSGSNGATVEPVEKPEPATAGTTADPPGSDTPPEQAIAALRAMPAWETVVDRAELLLRRGQHGVVYGVVGEPVTALPVDTGDDAPIPVAPGSAGFGSGAPVAPTVPPGPALRWLIDDTEGNGSLAIRVAFAGSPPAVGARVAVGGAWTVDADLTWYWQADALSPLAPHPVDPRALTEAMVKPGHVVTLGDPPTGNKPVSRAKDDGVITFQVIAAPDGEGDGWRIADELGDPPDAILYLPGERISYGGHDLRTPHERWTLRRGVTYWVHIDKIKKRTGELPPLMWARTPPVKW